MSVPLRGRLSDVTFWRGTRGSESRALVCLFGKPDRDRTGKGRWAPPVGSAESDGRGVYVFLVDMVDSLSAAFAGSRRPSGDAVPRHP